MTDELPVEVLRRKVQAYDDLFGEPTDLKAALHDAGHDTLVEWIEAETGDARGVSPEVKNALVGVHDDWIDIREGRTAQFADKANRRRAAKLFARFIDKLREDAAETGVIADQGALKMHGDRAAEVIAAEDTLPETGVSITVKRVFGWVVRGANRYDCACGDWEDCAHGLFRFRNEDGYVLAVDEGDWREYLSTVVETIEAVEAVTTDDEPDGSEDLADDASAKMDDLLAAEVADETHLLTTL
jgi:hypothetical protein